MGIKNFGKFLGKFPKASRKIKISEIGTKKLAIEMSGFVYKFCYTGTKSKSKSKNEYIKRFFNFFCKLLTNGIMPIGIFDGAPPEIKNATIQKRRDTKNKQTEKLAEIDRQILELSESLESKSDGSDHFQTQIQISKLKHQYDEERSKIVLLTEDIFDSVKLLCKYMGIPYYTSSGEADTLFSYLYKAKKIDGVISEDYDMFPFGIGLIYRQFDQMSDTIMEYNLNTLLIESSMTLEQLVNMCVLTGCDYTTHTMNIFDAYSLIYEFVDIENLHNCGETNLSDKVFKQCIIAVNEFLNGSSREKDIVSEEHININKTIDYDKLNEFLNEMCNFRKTTIPKWIDLIKKSYWFSVPFSEKPEQKVETSETELINNIIEKMNMNDIKSSQINIEPCNDFEFKSGISDNFYIMIIYMKLDNVYNVYLTCDVNIVIDLLYTNLIQHSDNERDITSRYIKCVDFREKHIELNLDNDEYLITCKKLLWDKNQYQYNVIDYNFISFETLKDIKITL